MQYSALDEYMAENPKEIYNVAPEVLNVSNPNIILATTRWLNDRHSLQECAAR
jgi:hypothetical protein